ncbi:putative toxin-antitoxin system toxin component, PIN family [Neomoorella thermoacetica]|uniref:PIN domain protein n=3 Tax=Neomoorella thermoacetica TaxID=1525 RepID=A0A1J5JMH7_NEOTH|nr:putative toxin-antitoxin system toxin component, PIN family [Moorella thermoacetica]AKX93398.1 PIN domain protein [Moorella thermoacetica]AKX96048.1 PIN domain protein [Moorella thermoacetica]APC07766.1 PIN domain protein [Moorella thermoacetica]OIQ07939.1 PIN domain protein [Moorella thermoacetica]OIQ10646.1 PIN domain protein [Moorella thermoacetica]
MKVVLDTNVVISGLLVPEGPPGRIIDLWADGKIDVVVSPAVITEYMEVFLRPKFAKAGTMEERQQLLEGFINLANTILVLPDIEIDIINADPSDNRFLECARTGETDCIISGDSHLLALKEYEEIPIITPGQFLEMIPV